MSVQLSGIHLPTGRAWIQGERDRAFDGIRHVLEHLGCTITDLEPEVITHGSTIVPTSRSTVLFPAGSKHIRRPKEDTSLTGSGRRRRGAKPKPKHFSMSSRKGQVLVPGTNSDFIITYYRKDGESPMHFDLGVHEVEQDDAAAP